MAPAILRGDAAFTIKSLGRRNWFAALVFVAAAVLWSLGDLFLLTRYLTQASGLAPDEARGRYLAIFGLSWGVATTIAPLTVTQLLKTSGPTGLWLTSAAVAVVLAALQPWFRKRLA